MPLYSDSTINTRGEVHDNMHPPAPYSLIPIAKLGRIQRLLHRFLGWHYVSIGIPGANSGSASCRAWVDTDGHPVGRFRGTLIRLDTPGLYEVHPLTYSPFYEKLPGYERKEKP